MLNLSTRQFRDPALIEDVIRTLNETTLLPKHLTLEMTESTIMDDPEHAQLTLGRIHDLGVHLAIDDFGTGYSSLAHLTRFPFDYMKMDRSFIEALCSHDSKSVLISSMVQLGHAMSMQIVGEGIEFPEQLESLRRLGCDIAQGFHLSPPIGTDEVTELLIEEQHKRQSMTNLDR